MAKKKVTRESLKKIEALVFAIDILESNLDGIHGNCDLADIFEKNIKVLKNLLKKESETKNDDVE